ncbi:MAG: hydantoinase/oxoprolinase family protein [Methanomassiliicoccus sp.]|nr:hydantoinase/oxoprolinase family protein [Methanomassiliicoccus sp.]
MASFHSDTILGLGIDTGGTFTDAAVVDLTERKVIAKCKWPTTHHNLLIGLEGAIDKALELSQVPPSRLNLASVSTTLATNAILEGKGGDVGLIGIGWKPQSDWDLGARKQVFIPGGHDSKGRAISALSMEEVGSAIDDVSGNVDALAISSMFSVINPSHENEVKRLAKKRTGLPVVVGHDLTGELGIMERTITAVLNARLIPAIEEFLDSIAVILKGRGIDCPTMVVKGNGSLMKMEVARERPIETILSGPAASANGGMFLANENDCMVVDIGGTSTDIALLRGGLPGVSESGTVIGGWRTRVQTADIRTCAMGGDSDIYADRYRLHIGPERVVPLCRAGLEHPALLDRMRASPDYRFFKVNKDVVNGLSANEREIYGCLRNSGALSLDDLRSSLPGQHFIEEHLRSMMGRGLVVRLGFTPTDLLQVLGQYSAGDVRPSELALGMIADSLAMSREGMADHILRLIVTKISEEVLSAALFGHERTGGETKEFKKVMDVMAGAEPDPLVEMKPALRLPIVGVGAPAGAFIPLVGSRLGTLATIPSDYDVGNAVGAVASKVCESARVSILPMADRFHIESPLGVPISYLELEDARNNAEKMVSELVVQKARASGASGEVRVVVRSEEVTTLVGYPAREVIVCVNVSATGLADPEYARKA